MPDIADVSPPVPPRLIVSKPADEVANTSGERTSQSRRRAARASVLQEQGRSASSDWIDVDESPPRRRRTRRSNHRHNGSSRSSIIGRTTQPASESQVGRFFPLLGRILESTESASSSRPSTRGSDTKRSKDRSLTRRTRHRDDASSIHRRPARHRTGGVSRRTETVLRVNPSMLSVLTSLTATSDRSSGSNSTITQHSYNRRGSDTSQTPTGRPRRPGSEVESTMSSRSRSQAPNVFDYMVAPSDDGHDGQSIISASSSSSHYDPSDAGSSEAPGTPSSRSTFPSPTTITRSQSVAELRRKYDPTYASAASSVRSDSHSPDSSSLSMRKQPSVSDVAEDNEDEHEQKVDLIAPSEVSYDSRNRSSSRSSRLSRHSTDRLRRQEESMRQHITYGAQVQPSHYVDPVYGQHRSQSASSANSDRAYAHNMAMQQYQWPTPPANMLPPMLPQPMNGHIGQPQRPPAPDAPDLSQRTLAGYEMLALELSSADSTVTPVYRKFEYLNHRILLHLQDELSELEEQLRTLDEIIAQMDPALADGQRTPASRRGEAWGGSEMHHRRTHLLGRIFQKTEQYNRAMSAYAGMAKDAATAGSEQVYAYRRWMAKHAPVHEVEARFLQCERDLVAPGMARSGADRLPVDYAALAYLPVALMLPLLLFSIIPTLGGRLVVTALIAVGAFMVAATTRIRQLMPAREWAICGSAYALLMAAIAGCIPQHTA